MDRTQKIFAGILILAVIITGFLAFSVGETRPFGGEFDHSGLFNVKGEILEAKSFQQEGKGFKFLVAVKAVEVEQIGDGEIVTGLPVVGDIVTVDVEDSRFNLFVSQDNVKCRQTSVEVCTYEVTQKDVVLTVREVLGSSGLPEFAGTPK